MNKFDDLIKKIETLTLGEMAELVKALEEKFGISAAAPMAAGGAARIIMRWQSGRKMQRSARSLSAWPRPKSVMQSAG